MFEINRQELESRGYKYVHNIERDTDYWVKGDIVIAIDSLNFSVPYFMAFLKQKEEMIFVVI